MITTEDLKRIAKNGEKLNEGEYTISVYKDNDGWWCLDMFILGKGGTGGAYSKRLTDKTLQQMVNSIYEHIEMMKKVE